MGGRSGIARWGEWCDGSVHGRQKGDKMKFVDIFICVQNLNGNQIKGNERPCRKDQILPMKNFGLHEKLWTRYTLCTGLSNFNSDLN